MSQAFYNTLNMSHKNQTANTSSIKAIQKRVAGRMLNRPVEKNISFREAEKVSARGGQTLDTLAEQKPFDINALSIAGETMNCTIGCGV